MIHMYNHTKKHSSYTDFLETYVPELPNEACRPIFVVLCGLPGSRKSHNSNLITKKLPIVKLESDFIRKILFRTPTYKSSESRQLFEFCHALIDHLLSRSYAVLFDATNLVESHRQNLYRISDKNEAELIIIKTTAPENVIFDRLTKREVCVNRNRLDNSDATWTTYKKMIKSSEDIQREHLILDTSQDIDIILNKVIKRIRDYI